MKNPGSHRNHPTLLACLLLLPASAGAVETYEPKYADVWPEIDKKVHDSWDKSLVKADDLPKPFTGVWNLLFYWDVYFTNEGLLVHKDKAHIARDNIDNQLFEVEKFGFVPNANASWGKNRSQTPFLSMMVRAVYENSQLCDKAWLKAAYGTLKKEYAFWTDDSNAAIENHSTTIKGLQRFGHHASKKEMIEFYDGPLVERFGYRKDTSEDEKIANASPKIAEAETMDFTPRFGDRCTDFAAIDLNSNLYTYERNFAWMVKELGLDGEPDWEAIAARRRELIQKYCWSEQRGLFMDYDFVNKCHNKVASIGSLYPLWAGIATREQAKRLVENLPLFEFDWGVAVCEKSEQKHRYQWDYPACWPPVQYLAVAALHNCGYKQDALRIASKYLDICAKNFRDPQPRTFKRDGKEVTRNPGKLYEKYKIDGTINDDEYPCSEFMGWSAGVFVYCHDYVKNSQ